MPDLIQQIEQKNKEFDFFQIVNLLEEYFSSGSEEEKDGVEGNVRFSANPGITFPSSDIHSVNLGSEGVIKIFLSFMGLLGISSPLPQYFVEYGARESGESDALSDFLNIFDHRIYTLFYRAWRKYRLVPTFSQNENFDLYRRFAFLAGLEFEKESDKTILEYAGLFSSVCHSADGLAQILTNTIDCADVFIEQWVGRWAEVKSKRFLGLNLTLGNEAMVGERIFDRSGKIRIIICIRKDGRLQDFLPESSNIKKIRKIVKLFSPNPLEFDISLNFTSADLDSIVLGKDNGKLGINGCCGEKINKNELYETIIN